MECVFQYPFAILKEKGFPLRGKWNEEYFNNDNPIPIFADVVVFPTPPLPDVMTNTSPMKKSS